MNQSQPRLDISSLLRPRNFLEVLEAFVRKKPLRGKRRKKCEVIPTSAQPALEKMPPPTPVDSLLDLSSHETTADVHIIKIASDDMENACRSLYVNAKVSNSES